MERAALEQVRSFNRSITQRVGALNDAFLGRPRSLGASRLLFEIGPAGAEVRALRARLGLDSGYASRLLRALEGDGLIVLGAAPTDRRVRVASLTDAGRSELALLNRRADEVADALLEPLGEGRRRVLLEAMAVVERLLRASAVRVGVEDAASEGARRCVARYFAELGRRFPTGFDPDLSTRVAPQEMNPPRGRFVLARLDGEPVGGGGLKIHERFGEIKRMWVDPAVRGLGIGRRILDALEAQARAYGLDTLRLETNENLAEALALYRSHGYREVPPFNDEPYAQHWFEKDLSVAHEADA